MQYTWPILLSQNNIITPRLPQGFHAALLTMDAWELAHWMCFATCHMWSTWGDPLSSSHYAHCTVPSHDVDNVDMVLQLKQDISADDMCSELSIGFKHILKHAHTLVFTQRPNYNLLQSYVEGIQARLLSAATATFDQQSSCPSSPTISATVTPIRKVPSQWTMPTMPVGFVEKKVCVFFYVLVQSNVDN